MEQFDQKIKVLKDGSYDVFYREKRYLLSKETHLGGKLIKLYAKALGGKDFISLNYYPKTKKPLLKPCEMPEEKVIEFVLHLSL
jgi:hypothetical protein